VSGQARPTCAPQHCITPPQLRHRHPAGAEQCTSDPDAAEPRPSRYNYTHVFSRARDAGVSFWGERAALGVAGGVCSPTQPPAALAHVLIAHTRPPCHPPCPPPRSRPCRAPTPDLPGYSRSVYAADHALITPESRVWAPNTYGWCVCRGWRGYTCVCVCAAAGAVHTVFVATGTLLPARCAPQWLSRARLHHHQQQHHHHTHTHPNNLTAGTMRSQRT
jgi:hypothetical protein